MCVCAGSVTFGLGLDRAAKAGMAAVCLPRGESSKGTENHA